MLQKLFYSIFYFVFFLFITIWLTATFFLTPIIQVAISDYDLSLSDDTTITFDPVKMTLDIRELGLSHKSTQLLEFDHLVVDVELFSLLRGQVGLQNILLDGLTTKIKQDGEKVLINGVDIIAVFTKSENTAEPTPEAESTMPQSATNEVAKPLPVSVNKLELKNINVEFEQPTINAALILNSLVVNDFSFKDQRIDLSTLVDAHISLSLIQEDVAPTTITTNLQFETDFNLAQDIVDNNPSLTLKTDDLQLVLTQLAITAQGYQINNQKMALASESLLFEMFNNTPIAVTAALDYELQNLVIKPQNQGQTIDGETLNLGNLSLDHITLKNAENTISFKPTISIEQAALEQLIAMRSTSQQGDETSLINLEYLKVDAISASEQLIMVDAVNLGELLVDAMMTKDKQLSPLYLVKTATSADETTTTQGQTPQSEPTGAKQGSGKKPKTTGNKKTKPKSTGKITKPEEVAETDHTNSTELVPAIVLGSLQFDKPAKIKFNDNSVKSNYRTVIDITELTVSEVNSTKPELISKVKLKLTQDAYTKIDLTADLQPFRKTPQYDIKLTVDELSLPELSPYVSDALGYNIESGQMDTNVELNIDGKVLVGNSLTYLKSVELNALEDTGERKQISGGAISFNAALGMLKDGDDVVELDIPITGNLDKPSVGLSGIMSLIIKQATMSAAKDYLITSFLPYSKVIKIAMSASDHLLKVNFESLNYPNNSAELSDEQVEYVQQLTAALKENTSFNIKLCPVATNDELIDQNKEARIALAQRRGLLLKQALVNDYGVASKRLYSCTATIDTDKAAKPRIDIEQL